MSQSSQKVRRSRLRVLPWVAFASLLGLAGCSEDPTELLVVVDTDLSIPAEMDNVSISVTGPSGDEAIYPVALTGTGAVALPLVLGLVPEGDLLEPVTIRATGLLGATPVVERSVRTGFLENEIHVVRLLLLKNCVGRMCAADESCSEDGCVPVFVAAATLPRWSGPPDRLDAGGDRIDADMGDTGVPDTGMPDTGMGDTGTPDTGMGDTGTPDAGTPDAGTPDAGMDGGLICGPDTADCDGMAGNGCETSLTTVTNCGGCGTACTRAHASGDCSTGSCRLGTCDADWGNCDGSYTNGCESSLTSLSNCGACGTTCSRAHASETCSTGMCRLDTCDADWGNCDGSYTNGCETSLTSLSNCGGCGTTCSRAHASGDCSTGSCRLGTCDAGWGNCDGSYSNGCESNLTLDPNCGMCGLDCTLPDVCMAGTCG